MYKKVIVLSVPYILSNLTVPLVSSFDTAFVGNLSDERLIGGISLGVLIFNFLYWGLNFLRMGTTAIVVKSVNKGRHYITKIFSQNIKIAIFLGFILIMSKSLISEIFVLIDSDPVLLNSAKKYYDIRIFAAPFTLSNFVILGWLVGEQKSFLAVIHTLVVNIANISLSYFFIYQQNLSIEGAAYGTALSQFIGFIFGIGIFLSPENSFYFFLKDSFFEFPNLRELVSNNFNIFVRTLVIVVVISFLKWKSAEISVVSAGVIAILIELILFISFFIDGLAFSAEGLIGEFYRENKWRELKKCTLVLQQLGLFVGGTFFVILNLFFEDIFSIYTSHEEIIEAGVVLKNLVLIIPLICSFTYIWDGIYIGMNKFKKMRDSVLISGIAFFLIWEFGKYYREETQVLLISFSTFLALRSLIQTIFSLRPSFYCRG